ncbi:MAG: isopentenyl phosphate kinase [halophilic archaeon J07HX64]|jgi:isopentenyl phosphate kinase (EC 2.7.4.-)|nr:MAG: isopentenyl phosphate kinase [halophilic archaeon J07HX64]
MTTVLKLGGSVLTDKHSPETVDEEALATAAEVIGKSLDASPDDPRATVDEHPPVVIHGGGSFGHPAAAEHGVSASEGTRDSAALVDIHRAMGRLLDRVVTALHRAGVPALPVRPLSFVRRTETGLACPTRSVEAMLAEGFVPVLHGDVVVHEGAGGTVASGDDLVVALAAALGAGRVGVCSTVPGVLDDGEVVPEIRSYESVADVLGDSEATDVTGGMAGKVQSLLTVDGPAAVFGLDELGTFLETGQAGTIIR